MIIGVCVIFAISCNDINDFIEDKIPANIKFNYFEAQLKLKELNNSVTEMEFDASKAYIHTFSDYSRISFSANSFVLNDNPIGSKIIKVTVRKVLNKKQMLANGVSTNSNNEILESAGMFYTQAFYEGKELDLAPGAKYSIQIPTSVSVSPKMEMFYGEVTEKGINWQEADNDPNTQNNVKKSEWRSDSNRYILGLQCFPERLKWVNCDFFKKFEGVKLTEPCLEADIVPNGDTITLVSFCVFKNLNIVISPCCEKANNICFASLPIGEDVIYILIGKGKHDYYFGHIDKRSRKMRSPK